MRSSVFNKRLALVVGVLFLTVSFVSGFTGIQCLGKDDTVKIGAFYPLSGAIADTGARCKNAVETALEIINNEYPKVEVPLAASKGLPNLEGAKVEAIFVDHKGSPEKGKAAATRLIEQKGVAGLVGGYNSGVTKAASIAAERYGAPLVNGSSSSSKLHQQGFETFFRVYSYDKIEVKAIFQQLNTLREQGHDIETVGVVYMSGEYGEHMNQWAQKYAKKYGYEVVASSKHPFGASSVSGAVLRMKSADPDVVIHATLLSDMLLFLDTYKDLGWAPKGFFLPCSGYQDPMFAKRGGAKAEYIFGTQIFKLDRVEKNPSLEVIDDIYREKSDGLPIDGVVLGVFEATVTLANAINNAGTTSPDAVIKALNETDISWPIDIGGGVDFNEKGQNTKTAVVISQILDGKYRTVLPLKEATTDYVFPMPKWGER